MNTFIKIIAYILKFLNFWVFVFPMKYEIIATFIYIGIMYLLFGTAYMGDLSSETGPYAISYFGQVMVFIFFGLPSLIGFFSWLSGGSSSSENSASNHLDNVIAHRDMMMRHSSPKDSYEIMKKTAHLDVMKSNPKFNDAINGFNATTGITSPSKTYRELMKK